VPSMVKSWQSKLDRLELSSSMRAGRGDLEARIDLLSSKVRGRMDFEGENLVTSRGVRFFQNVCREDDLEGVTGVWRGKSPN
jgi:hypothetical protein